MTTLPVKCYCLHCDESMTLDLLSQNTTVRCPYCDQPNRKHVLTMRTASRFLLVDYACFLVLLAVCNLAGITSTSTTIFIAVCGSVLSCLALGWMAWQAKHG